MTEPNRANGEGTPGVRWVLAKTGLAHLDVGERSSRSRRVRGEHIVVTACRAHLSPDAEEVPSTHPRRCSNCVREAFSECA
jgi:hypothetical protein